MTTPKGKFLLRGDVENITPLHIGSGDDDKSDMDILTSSDGVPFIPATALIGVLLHSFRTSVPGEKIEKLDWKRFWGYAGKEELNVENRGIGYESRFRCSDLNVHSEREDNSESFQIVIRDGIKIDNTRNIAKDKSKFNYQLLEPGTRFKLNAEFSFMDSDKEFVEKMVSTTISFLTDGNLFIGKMTNKGFGRIHLAPDSIELYQFDFKEKNDALAWLLQDFSKKSKLSTEALPDPYVLQSDVFRIHAKFQLKHSLIVRSYSANPDEPDAVHLKSGNKSIIPGSSLKGAIRARAERIANTINRDRAKTLVEELFGRVDTEQSERKAKKSKVRIGEIVLLDYTPKTQTRIQIDRFTGGAIDGKLFETMPIFINNDSNDFEVEITIADLVNKEAAFGLLLLVLKDLWNGDVAVGGEKNVGRGILKGIEATINYNGDELIIPEDISQINPEHQSRLQSFVEEFNKWMRIEK